MDRAILQRREESRFGLARVKVGRPQRLGRLLMALTIALSWLTLMGLPEGGVLPPARRLSLFGRRLGESERDKFGAFAVGETWEPAVMLSTSAASSGVGGYA